MTTRFEELTQAVERHQLLAAENYDRVRAIAEHVRGGFCEYLAAADGDCVHLVPPGGPYEAKDHGDNAFSMPPKGFRPIVPILFGLAVRVTASDWMRVVLQCVKEGEHFTVYVEEDKSHEFELPLPEDHMVNEVFYDMLHAHLLDEFRNQIEAYEQGEYGGNEIGFRMNLNGEPVAVTRPVDAVATSVKAARSGGKTSAG